MKITSTANPRIREALALRKAAVRKSQGLFLIEGEKEIAMAVGAGLRLRTVFYCRELLHGGALPAAAIPGEPLELSREVYNKLAYRDDGAGIMAVAEQPDFSLAHLQLAAHPLIMVVERIEKPGNLGAILRTADAAAADAVLVCDAQTDLLNPNVVRASLGTLFTVPLAQTDSEAAHAWLLQRQVNIVAVTPEGRGSYTAHDFSQPTALVLGSEADGLSDFWKQNSHQQVSIPMHGAIDSLNVSVAAAIVVFEALRQRGKG
jgi:TrmH family RNA methyltransferase